MSGFLAVLAVLITLLAAGMAPAAEPVEALTRHDYVLHCAGCHKFDGTGSARIPDLYGIAELVGRPGWREYLVRVPGVAQAPLSDERLARLLDWVLARFAGAPDTPAFTAATVGPLRARPLRDPFAARARLEAAPAPPHP